MYPQNHNTKLKLVFALFMATLIGGCQLIQLMPTPPSGWRSPVSKLIVDDSAFPKDWVVLFTEDTKTDPETNHVGRRWGYMSGAKAEQGIWRAYTIADAEEKYKSLRSSQFQPTQTLLPGTIFVEFKPPIEITFQSRLADEFYLACGWWGWSYCEVVARYRNYVTDVRMDLQADRGGVHTDGLTYEEVENIIKTMDAKFSKFLSGYPEPAPAP
jgi:hypothetical protein